MSILSTISRLGLAASLVGGLVGCGPVPVSAPSGATLSASDGDFTIQQRRRRLPRGQGQGAQTSQSGLIFGAAPGAGIQQGAQTTQQGQGGFGGGQGAQTGQSGMVFGGVIPGGIQQGSQTTQQGQ
jgi:hypothetical protein